MISIKNFKNISNVSLPMDETLHFGHIENENLIVAIDKNGNRIPFDITPSGSQNFSILIPRLEENGKARINGAIAGGTSDEDAWVDRNGNFSDIVITCDNFSDGAISAQTKTIVAGASNLQGGLDQLTITWTPLGAGTYTFDMVFTSGATIVTVPYELILT